MAKVTDHPKAIHLTREEKLAIGELALEEHLMGDFSALLEDTDGSEVDEIYQKMLDEHPDLITLAGKHLADQLNEFLVELLSEVPIREEE